MIQITLKNDVVKEFDSGVTVAEIAKSLGMGLYKAACAAAINGKVCDLRTPVTEDAKVEILTFDDEDGRKAFRHTASHILAQAVKRLYPQAKLAIGPAIDNGFYYDFDVDFSFTPEILEKIEAEMKKIVKEALPLERHELAPDEAIRYMADKGEIYKVELIQEHAGKGENITFYKQGEFDELCAGPHLPDTSRVKAFKLTSATGAYWRGDSKNKMLQRIYGTAFPKQAELEAYLAQVEEAKKRDHNKLGRELELFTTAEEWYYYDWELNEPGRILLRCSKDSVNKTILLDMNGKEIWSFKDIYIELGESSSHYFVGGIQTQKPDDVVTKYGILDENGEWVVPPIYDRTYVFHDRFFAIDNGYEVEVSDTNRDTIARLDGSGYDAPTIKCCDGELIFDEWDHDTSRRLWYAVNDGKPIMPKGVTVLDTFFCEESGCFFGLDEGGTGYLYTRDGTVLKTFPQGISCYASNWEGMVEVNTGSEQKTTTHVIDPGTKQEAFRFVSRDEASNQGFDMEIRPKDTQRYAILTAYPIEDTNEDRLTQVYDTETDKVILDRCSVADLFIVNGKTYCTAIRNDQCVVLDQNGAVLLRMPCAYLD